MARVSFASADRVWIMERYLKLKTSLVEPSDTEVKAHISTTWFPWGLVILSFRPGWRCAERAAIVVGAICLRKLIGEHDAKICSEDR